MCGLCDTEMQAGIMVCVLFLICWGPEVGRGFNMCRGHNVSVQCQLQVVLCSHHGERKSWVVGWEENLPVTLV